MIAVFSVFKPVYGWTYRSNIESLLRWLFLAEMDRICSEFFKDSSFDL